MAQILAEREKLMAERNKLEDQQLFQKHMESISKEKVVYYEHETNDQKKQTQINEKYELINNKINELHGFLGEELMNERANFMQGFTDELREQHTKYRDLERVNMELSS